MKVIVGNAKPIRLDNGGWYIVVTNEYQSEILKVKMPFASGGEIPERARISFKDGDEIRLFPEKEEDEKDDRVFLLDKMDLVFFSNEDSKEISFEKSMTTADILKIGRGSSMFRKTLAYAAIFSPGDTITSTRHSNIRRVISYENGEISVSNVECRGEDRSLK